MKKELKIYRDEFGCVIIESSSKEVLNDVVYYLTTEYVDFVDFKMILSENRVELWDKRNYIPKILSWCINKRKDIIFVWNK